RTVRAGRAGQGLRRVPDATRLRAPGLTAPRRSAPRRLLGGGGPGPADDRGGGQRRGDRGLPALGAEVAVDGGARRVERPDRQLDGGRPELLVRAPLRLLEEVGALEENVAEALEVETLGGYGGALAGEFEDFHWLSVNESMTTERRHCMEISM